MPDKVFRNRVRVGGSGFTIFTFGGQPISFCQQVAHTSPQPVGGGVSAIHPMDEPYPIEIITPVAAGMGQLTLNMFELFGTGGAASKAWERLGVPIGGGSGGPFGSTGPENASTQLPIGSDGLFKNHIDIVDIFITQAKADPNQLNVVKIIRPAGAGGDTTPYTEEYHGCVITNVIDGEQIEVGTMEVIKQITISYRYVTRNGQGSQAFAFRDGTLHK